MKLFIIVFLLSIFVALRLTAQNIDSINIYRAKTTLHNCFGTTVSEEFWLYNINNDYLLIKKKESVFLLYYLKEKNCIIDSTILMDSDSALKNMLTNFQCQKCFAYTETDSTAKYNYWHKGFIYFLYLKNGVTMSEFNLPTLFQLRNNKRDIYPIKDKLNDLLFTKLMYYSQVKFHRRK